MKKAVIIGGGLGGLFAGAILSKEGLDVTVIEKNATIGGGLQSFRRFGEIFDTGMHVLGGMREGGNIRRICEYLGIMDDICIRDVDHDCMDLLYFKPDNMFYRIAEGHENFVKSLAGYFPDEEENIRRYVDAMYEVVDQFDLYNLRPTESYLSVLPDAFCQSATDFIASFLKDKKLQNVAAYMNPLYSGERNVTPAYVHCVISVLYIDGPSRLVDGSYKLAETLGQFIERNGGRVLRGEKVTSVLTEDRTVKAVKTSKNHEYSADYYISAINPKVLFTLLDDPKAFPKAYRTRINGVKDSLSAFSLNIKLKPGTVRFLNSSGYYSATYDRIWEIGREPEHWPDGFLFMTPPEDPQPEFCEKMIIISPMAWQMAERWDDTTVGHRGDEYLQWKEECKEKLLDLVDDIIPDIRSKIESINTASPLTIRDFYASPGGSMYGMSKDCNNIIASQLPVVTKVHNLFLTGQCINLHGFCGVPLTAIDTCEAILGKNYIVNKL